MNEAEKNLADFYKHESEGRFAGWKAEDVLAYNKETNPNFKKRYKQFTDIQAGIEKDSEAEWAKQHDFANAVEIAAGPGKWFQQNIMGPVVEKLSENDKDLSPMNPAKQLFDLSKGINRYASGVVNSEDEYIAKGLDRTNLGGIIGSVKNPLHTLNRDVHEAILELNPLPESTGQAIVGAGMAGVMQVPGVAGEGIKKLTPQAVEGAFNSAAKVLPGANRGFLDKKAAIRAAEEKIGLGHLEDIVTGIRKTEEASKSLALQKADALIMEKKAEQAAYQKNLTGSEKVIPQLRQSEVGTHVSSSLSELNPYSNAALTSEPIIEHRNQILKQLEDTSIPLHTINDGLEGVKNLNTIINTPSENTAGVVLDKYLKKPNYEEPFGSVTSKPTTVTAATVHEDASALGELARRADKANNPLAARMYKEAQQVLRNAVSDNVSPELGKAVIQNRRDWAEWYKTYKNEHIEKITSKLVSQNQDPIFASEESIQAYRNATSPAEWEYVKKNKVNDLVETVLNSEDPNKEWAKELARRPGYYESWLSDTELNNMQGLANSASEAGAKSILHEDLIALEKERIDLADGAGKRREDQRTLRRSGDDKLQPVVDNTRRDQNILMGVGGAGFLGALAYHNAHLAALMGGVGMLGFTPEYLGRLYLAAPEVRAKLLDVGRAKNHIEAVKAAAVLSTFLEGKQREIQQYEQTDKEGKKKPLPKDLEKYKGINKDSKPLKDFKIKRKEWPKESMINPTPDRITPDSTSDDDLEEPKTYEQQFGSNP